MAKFDTPKDNPLFKIEVAEGLTVRCWWGVRLDHPQGERKLRIHELYVGIERACVLNVDSKGIVVSVHFSSVLESLNEEEDEVVLPEEIDVGYPEPTYVQGMPVAEARAYIEDMVEMGIQYLFEDTAKVRDEFWQTSDPVMPKNTLLDAILAKRKGGGQVGP